MSCRGRAVSVGGERRHVLRLDNEIFPSTSRSDIACAGLGCPNEVGGSLLSFPQFCTDIGYVADDQPF